MSNEQEKERQIQKQAEEIQSLNKEMILRKDRIMELEEKTAKLAERIEELVGVNKEQIQSFQAIRAENENMKNMIVNAFGKLVSLPGLLKTN